MKAGDAHYPSGSGTLWASSGQGLFPALVDCAKQTAPARCGRTQSSSTKPSYQKRSGFRPEDAPMRPRMNHIEHTTQLWKYMNSNHVHISPRLCRTAAQDKRPAMVTHMRASSYNRPANPIKRAVRAADHGPSPLNI